MAFTNDEVAQIIEQFFKTVGARQYIGARYVPIFGRKGEDSIEWDGGEGTYEPLTIVLYQGNSYTSRQFVPVGVEITNAEFWANTGNYNAQVEQYRRETATVLQSLDSVSADVDSLQKSLPNGAFDENRTVKGYVDLKDSDMRVYVDGKSSEMKTYVDQRDSDTKAYVDGKITTTNDSIGDLRDTMEEDYIQFPESPESKYGTASQVLSTLANGKTQWVNPVNPSDEQADEYITAWLNAHPEATTTVQDNSINGAAKLIDGSVPDSKLVQSGGVVDGLSYAKADILNLSSGKDVTLLEAANWAVCGLSNETGEPYYPQQYRVSTLTPFYVSEDTTINVPNYFYITVFPYDGTNYTAGDTYSVGKFTLTGGTSYKFRVRRQTEDTYETADIQEFVSGFTITSKLLSSVNSYINKTDKISAKIEATMALKDVPISVYANFVNGGLDDSGIIFTPQTWRVSSPDLIKMDDSVYINVASGYLIRLLTQVVGGYTAFEYTGPVSAQLLAGKNYKVQIRKVPETASGVADIDEFTSAVTISRYAVQDLAITQNIITDVIGSETELPISEIGTFVDGGLAGINLYPSQVWRVSSVPPITCPFNMRITVGAGFRLFTRGMTNGEYDESKNIDYASGSSFEVSKGTQFACVILRNVEDTSEVADVEEYTNAIKIVALGMYPITQIPIKAFRKNQCAKFISHQGYSYTDFYGHSIASNYVNSGDLGFDIGETDIVFTADDVPVCCHDASFVDSDDGTTTVIIAESTYAQLLTHGYYGSKIASLDDVIKTCKTSGLELELDHIASGWSSTRWESIFDSVSRYGMKDHILWVANGNQDIMTHVLSFDSNPRVMINASDETSFRAAVSAAETIKSTVKEVIVACNHSNVSASIFAELAVDHPDIKLCAWTIDTAATIQDYLPYVSYITSNKISYQMLL